MSKKFVRENDNPVRTEPKLIPVAPLIAQKLSYISVASQIKPVHRTGTRDVQEAAVEWGMIGVSACVRDDNLVKLESLGHVSGCDDDPVAVFLAAKIQIAEIVHLITKREVEFLGLPFGFTNNAQG